MEIASAVSDSMLSVNNFLQEVGVPHSRHKIMA